LTSARMEAGVREGVNVTGENEKEDLRTWRGEGPEEKGGSPHSHALSPFSFRPS
jgi:hypothetical protein